MSITQTPAPPYYAVIFTSQRTEGDQGYNSMAEKVLEIAGQQAGFLGAESVRNEAGLGITVSYWQSLEAIEQFKNHSLHAAAQKEGRNRWYSEFGLRVCKVERDSFL